jgi:multiple antibiotic resistance protein
MNDFWLCFVPLFVAVDAIGVLPIFLGFTDGIKKARVRKIVLQSVLTASVVGLAFLFLGEAVLRALGISVADFMIAGGIVLLIISINDIISFEKKHKSVDEESMGAVPIGVPLIVGPAVLTTSILLVREYGPWVTVLSLVINILFAGVVFWFSGAINRVLGKTGAKTFSKLAHLLLAAISVMIMRKGIMIYLSAKM